MVRHGFPKHTTLNPPTLTSISKPNTTSSIYDLEHILNYICFKKTGCYLPSSFFTQDWFYKVDETGKRRAFYKPSSIPALLRDPYRAMMPDDLFIHKLKRHLIVDELKDIFTGRTSQAPMKDCGIYYLLPMVIATTRTGMDTYFPEYEYHSERRTLYNLWVECGCNMIDPRLSLAIYDASKLLFKSTKGEFRFYNIPGSYGRTGIGEDGFRYIIHDWLRVCNFPHNNYYLKPQDRPHRIEKTTDKDLQRTIMYDLNIFNVINSIGAHLDCDEDVMDKWRAFEDFTYKVWLNKKGVRSLSQTEYILGMREDISDPESAGIGDCAVRRDGKRVANSTYYEGYRAHRVVRPQYLESNGHYDSDSYGDNLMPKKSKKIAWDITPIWFGQIKGENKSNENNFGHTLSQLTTKHCQLPVKQTTWSPCFWLLNAEHRDDIQRSNQVGNYHYGNLMGTSSTSESRNLASCFGGMSRRRGGKKVWDKVKKESALLTQFERPEKDRFMRSLMIMVSNN